MRYHRCFTGLITVATLLLGNPAAADVAADVKHLQERWAEINYQMEGNTQETAFDALMKEAEAIVAANPTSADALIWSGIIKSTYAGAKGGLGALALAKASKADLEKALEITPMRCRDRPIPVSVRCITACLAGQWVSVTTSGPSSCCGRRWNSIRKASIRTISMPAFW